MIRCELCRKVAPILIGFDICVAIVSIYRDCGVVMSHVKMELHR